MLRGAQEQGGPDHPRLVVAALVLGPLLVGHGGELVGGRGPFLKIAWTHLGLGSSGKGVVRDHLGQLRAGKDDDLGLHAQVLGDGALERRGDRRGVGSSLVETTLPL